MMVRVVKKPEERRQEILDAAQALVGRQGYNHTSVQNIIDEIGIAKGTFYHYFDSKEALLEALIDRILIDIVQSMEKMAADASLDALRKFNAFYAGGAEIKMGYRPLLEPLLPFYLDENSATMREKTMNETVRHVAPVLGRIIEQGVAEGVFSATYPDLSAAIVLQMGQQMGFALVPYFFNPQLSAAEWQAMQAVLAAYEEAAARVLGADPAAIRLVNPQLIDQWHAGLAAQEEQMDD